MPDINWEVVGTIYCIVAFFVWMDSVDFDGMLVAATKGILWPFIGVILVIASVLDGRK